MIDSAPQTRVQRHRSSANARNVVAKAIARAKAAGQRSCLRVGRKCRSLVYGVKRARPFNRRACKTLRPLRVALRARNPCVRARFRRLGLNVCFMATAPRRKDPRWVGSRKTAKSWATRKQETARSNARRLGLRDAAVPPNLLERRPIKRLTHHRKTLSMLGQLLNAEIHR